MSKPILSVDFDGVLHSYSSGWRGMGNIPDAPVKGALQWLIDLHADDHFRVAIFSSRSKTLRGRWAMKAWLRKWIIAQFDHQVDCRHWEPLYLAIPEWVEWPWFKPSAMLTIDDRALTFDGTFPTKSEMVAFKPWNKRAARPIK